MQVPSLPLFPHFTRLIVAGLLVLVPLSGCQPATPKTRKELVLSAETHLRSGEFHKALSELSQALRQDPKNAQVHLDLAWVYLYTNRMDKALTEIRLAESALPSPEPLYHIKGAVYARLDQWVDALDTYNKALKNDYNNPQLHADIADAFLHVNEPEAALREYTMAFKLDPTNSLYPYGRCKANLQLNRYSQAVDACQTAMALAKTPEQEEAISGLIENIKLIETLEKPTRPH